MLVVVPERRWDDLAEIVRRRRDLLQLRQADLEARGGPSAGTVKNIEQVARDRYSPRTFVQLERALDWEHGLVEKILDGTATEEQINARVARVHAPIGGVRWPDPSAGAPTDDRSGDGDDGPVVPLSRAERADPSQSTLTLAALLLARMESEPMTPRVVEAVHALTAALPDLQRRPPTGP